MKSHPYTLEKKENKLRLTIKPKNSKQVLYLCCTILFSLIFTLHIVLLILTVSVSDITLRFILIIGIVLFVEIFLILFFFSSYWWRRKGIEIFVLSSNRLEYLQMNKPFKTEKNIFNFEKLEIGYQSGEDFYSEEEAKLLGVELELDKAKGNYPIQFYMNNGEKVIDSEREIPISTIIKVRDQFLTIRQQYLS